MTPLSSTDWAVLVLYFVVIAGVGAWMSRGQESNNDFLLGGRSIPWWAALLSLVATEISAATFLGAPEQGYRRNLTYLQFGIGSILARFVLAHYFISVYYKAGVTTVYEFLQRRFGRITQKTTAGLFLFGRLFADGSRLFMAAITIEVATGMGITWSILLLCFVTICYTAAGGIKAVIWTDVLQAVVLVGAGLALLASLFSDTGLSLGQCGQELSEAGKLVLFQTEGNPLTDPYHLLTALIGGFFLTMATHGTDHDMVQRLLTCKDDAGSRRSTWLSGLVGMAVTVLFLTVGLFLFLNLQHQPPESDLAVTAAHLSKDGKNGHYLLYYALAKLPKGLIGLIVAGVLAAAMSSLSSAFNAMTATFISDFYRDIKKTTPREELIASRIVTLLFGTSVAAVALGVAYYNRTHPEIDLLSLALGVMTFFYGGLLGIFLVALFTKTRGSEVTNVAAAVISTIVVFTVAHHQLVAWPWNIVIGTVVAFVISALGSSEGFSSQGDN